MSQCTDNLKDYLGDELKSKLGDVLKDATDSSPLGLAQKALGQAQKLQDTKSVVSQGIQSFKQRVGLPAGRMDGLGGLNLGAIKQKADALKPRRRKCKVKSQTFNHSFPDARSIRHHADDQHGRIHRH